MKKSDLPEPLQTMLDISKTNRVNIDLIKKSNTYTPDTNSKVGGIGYLPIGENYPTKKDGTPLVMLAQINFEQVSQTVDISQLPHELPNKGILQIYIDNNDDVYGADFDNYLPHAGYQVRFWQDDSLPVNADELNKITEQLKTLNTDWLPFDAESQCEMIFSLSEQSCCDNCFEYNRFSKNIDELKDTSIWNYIEEDLGEDDPDEILCTYDELANTEEHQLLGYPNFTQTDPREYNENLQEHILLFQIVSDDDSDILWGDCGIANFFIHPNNLKNKDFSKLLYNWDCS